MLVKIVVVGTRGFPGVAGGIERHCEQLYPRLASLGCRVDVLARRWCFPPPAQLPWYHGVGMTYLSCPRSRALETLGHSILGVIVAALRGADILHIHGVGPAILVPFARVLGLKVVFTHHGPDYQRAQWGRWAKWLLRLGERWGCQRAHAVIAISVDIEERVNRHRAGGCVRIPNGVNETLVPPADHYLSEIGVHPGQYVLAVGRFVEDKGFHDLIEAFVTTYRQGMPLVLVGGVQHTTPYSRCLEEKARHHGVLLPGILTGERLWALFAHARLFVLPSHYEGLPITLLEAMSFGIDVLVSDIPANRSLELGNDDYFPVGDVKALSGRLSKKLAGKPGRDFSAILDSNYRWPNIAAQTLAVYTAIVAKTSPH